MDRIPHAIEFHAPRAGRLVAWLTVLAIAAMVIGATVALVAVNHVPVENFRVTSR